MGWFTKAWNSVKNVGKKVLGWGHKAQVVGQKASRLNRKAHAIGQKVSRGYSHARGLYNEAKNIKTLDAALKFGKREGEKAAEYKNEANKVFQDTRRLGRDVKQLGRDTKASFGY
jgi:hypothetical protein